VVANHIKDVDVRDVAAPDGVFGLLKAHRLDRLPDPAFFVGIGTVGPVVVGVTAIRIGVLDGREASGDPIVNADSSMTTFPCGSARSFREEGVVRLIKVSMFASTSSKSRRVPRGSAPVRRLQGRNGFVQYARK
jgi:hypothetical protein